MSEIEKATTIQRENLADGDIVESVIHQLKKHSELLFQRSCPSVQFSAERFESISRAPAKDGVHVYYNPADIKQPYQAIGLITLNYDKNGQWNLSHETKLIDKVIRRVWEIGANGLILQVSQPQLSGPVSMRRTAIVIG